MIVGAATDYTQVGGNNTYYRSDTGFFNAELSDDCASTEITCATRNVGVPLLIPFVSDLDGDGVKEIIVFDGTAIRLYHNSNLEIIDSFSLSLTPLHAIIFDVDNDSRQEVIIVGNDEIEIIDYNGTDITQDANFAIMASRELFGLVHCKGVNDCIAFAIESSATDSVFGSVFNSTGVVIADTSLHTATFSGDVMCLPSLKSVSLADYDNDGEDEYIFSTSEAHPGYAEVNIHYINHNGTNILVEQTAQDQSNPALGVASCAGLTIDGFTSPLVFDIDGSSSNGLETVIGFMTGADDFKMYSFTSGGSALDDYPEITDGEGVLVSNVMRANVFSDTANEDFCVMGYRGTSLRRLNLICGSEQTGFIVETLDFVFDLPVSFNVSAGYNTITHAMQMSQVTTEGNNLDEFLNAYGVWQLDFTLIDELELIWENEKGDSAIIPVDYQDNTREDLLVLTGTNLWYIDDGFTNTPGQLTSYSINPCIDRTWILNTSVEILATIIDDEGDLVSARARLYEGTANEQDSGWTNNASSGTTFSFAFTANVTTPSATLSIYGRDFENPSQNTSVSVTFSVSTVGVSQGDCITTDTLEPTIEEDEDNLTPGSTLQNVMTGGGAIPESWFPLLAFGIIVGAWAATFGFLIQLSKEAPQLANNQLIMFFVPILAALMAWIFVIVANLLATWTIIFGIVVSAAVVGLKFFNYSNNSGSQF